MRPKLIVGQRVEGKTTAIVEWARNYYYEKRKKETDKYKE